MIQTAIVSGTDQARFEDTLNEKLLSLQQAGYFITHVRLEKMPDRFFAYIIFNIRRGAQSTSPRLNANPTDHGYSK